MLHFQYSLRLVTPLMSLTLVQGWFIYWSFILLLRMSVSDSVFGFAPRLPPRHCFASCVFPPCFLSPWGSVSTDARSQIIEHWPQNHQVLFTLQSNRQAELCKRQVKTLVIWQITQQELLQMWTGIVHTCFLQVLSCFFETTVHMGIRSDSMSVGSSMSEF